MSEPLNKVQLERLCTAIRGFVGNRIRDQATADDVAQDVLLKITRGIDSLVHSERLESWAFQIARNSVADYFRSAKPTEEFREEFHAHEIDTPDSESVFSRDEADMRQEIAAYIRSVVETLPMIYREALLLTEYEGLSQAELAGRLGLSLSAAKSRVQRARAMVKQEMEDCCHWTIDRYGAVVDVKPRTSAPPCDCDTCENS
ncbi:MAG: hypothetical protein BGO12_08070 [Verrucomicrobia bacterium 61-8]|nr:sigma-70 family RNA polymerase sigma factor [Verrucomicrobiota bacterium]OJV22480.1 MAG: hypothetical protein BGO12_08070 [Verrucomicrobia bacterium 61-8]